MMETHPSHTTKNEANTTENNHADESEADLARYHGDAVFFDVDRRQERDELCETDTQHVDTPRGLLRVCRSRSRDDQVDQRLAKVIRQLALGTRDEEHSHLVSGRCNI